MFARIYLGFLISILLAVACSYAVYNVVNDFRQEHFHRDATIGVIELINDSLARQTDGQQKQYMALAAKLLGAEFNVVDKQDRGVSDERLSSPQYSSSSDGSFSWLLSAQESTFRFVFREMDEQHYRGQFLLFMAEYKRRRLQSFSTLADYTREKMVAANMGDNLQTLGLDPQQLTRLKNGSVVVVYNESNPHIFTLYGFIDKSNSARVAVWSNVAGFNPLPAHVIAGLIMLAIAIVTLATLALVYSLQQRFKRLQQAVNAIGAGELNTTLAVNRRDEIGKLSLDINQMARKINDLVQGQRATLQAVSHELRTPLSRMRFRLELLGEAIEQAKASVKTTSSEKASDEFAQLDDLRNDITELEGLIDEVLTHYQLSRSPSLSLDTLTLVTMLEDELENQRLTNPAINFELNAMTHVTINASANLIQRAIRNVISNAAKHARGRVNVSLVSDSSSVSLSVDDDGLGIEPTERSRIFDPFYRIDSSRNKETGGYGLGLAIVKQVVGLHQGSINVTRSETLGGACFMMSLPISAHGIG